MLKTLGRGSYEPATNARLLHAKGLRYIKYRSLVLALADSIYRTSEHYVVDNSRALQPLVCLKRYFRVLLAVSYPRNSHRDFLISKVHRPGIATPAVKLPTTGMTLAC